MPDIEPTWIDYERPFLYPKQEAIFFGEHRYGLCEASTKAGKTHGCICWIVEETVINGFKGYNSWWVAPVTAQAKIAFRRIKNALHKSLYKANESDLYIEFPNGARLWFKSAEKPDNLYGEDVYAAVLDEASRARYDSFIALRSTLTATRGKLRMIGNVKGKANWFYTACRAAERGKPNTKFERITAWDAVAAGVVDRAEIEDARSLLPEKEFMELYEAKAMDDEDAFIPSIAVEEAMSADRLASVPHGGVKIIGADPSQGKRDPAAFAIREGRRIIRIEEHPGMDEEGFLGHLIRLIQVEKPARAFIDGTGFGTTISKWAASLGYGEIIVPIGMGNRSLYPDEYGNKRAECWGEMRKGLLDPNEPMAIEYDEGAMVEITCIRKKIDRLGRLLLEDKADLEARGYMSPNKGDAISLTFAEPVEFVLQGKINYPQGRINRNLA